MKAQSMHRKKISTILVGIIFVLTACSSDGSQDAPAESGELELVATTTFVGDVVRQVAGPGPRITVLLEPGQNPHAYQPAPRDMIRLSEADLVFANGFGLEEFLPDLLEGAENTQTLVEVSQGIIPLVFEGDDQAEEDHEEGGLDDGDHPEEADDLEHLGIDPHVWFDPNNIKIWTENIAAALAEADPGNKDFYLENASAYQSQLDELDSWIQEEVETIPVENRKLVTDHTSFGYFAEQYGFEQIGAVVPAPTTEVETSGRQLSELVETIREQNVKVIFVSMDIDPTMAEIVAEETGAELVLLYFGSLTEDDPANSYLAFMRYNVEAIASALSN